MDQFFDLPELQANIFVKVGENRFVKVLLFPPVVVEGGNVDADFLGDPAGDALIVIEAGGLPTRSKLRQAVEKAGTIDPDKVIAALPGIKVPNLTGGMSEMLPNHHITKPVFVGEVRDDGQFDVVWKTKGLVPGDAWSDHLPGSKDLKSDWVDLKCGNYNTATKKCGGQGS